MKFKRFIIFLQIIRVHTIAKINKQDDNKESLEIAVLNIAEKCFSVSEHRWSILLIITENNYLDILKTINENLNTSNYIVSRDIKGNNKFAYPQHCYDYLNNSTECQRPRPIAFIIAIQNPKQLDTVLKFLKNNIQGLWNPGSYFLIVLETKCDIEEYNNSFKVIWKYWILNAVILCYGNQNQSQLYTFNPYSNDHSNEWEIVLHETIPVSIESGNFNHSWLIFKLVFNVIKNSQYCNDIFFDKTSNLDGYVIPIGVGDPDFVLNNTLDEGYHWDALDRLVLKNIAEKLNFNVSKVVNQEPTKLEPTYIGILDDVFYGRSYLSTTLRPVGHYPGLGKSYPLFTNGVCFVTRNIGIRPQWKNLADAKSIWIAVGIGLLFTTLFQYLQNKSQGIISAFLDSERLVIGSSVIHTSGNIKYRIILGSILLVVLVVDGTIRGRFISTLTVVKPYPNLDTLEQLKKENVKIYGHESFRPSILDEELKARLNSNVIFFECFENLQREKEQRACVSNCRIIAYEVSNTTNLHAASSPIKAHYSWTVFTQHWPLIDRYNDEIVKLMENGIFIEWQLEIIRNSEINSWKLKRAEETGHVKSIKLDDILPAIMLLILGLMAALITFTWEKRSCADNISVVLL